jgi:plastocyanin
LRRRRVIAVAAAVAGVSTVLVAANGASAATKATPVRVTVTMSDFKFKLSKASVPKNTPVIFTVINRGPSPHDFDPATTKGTPVIPSSARTTLRTTFKRAGKVRYICTVPRHASFGMTGNLVVK